MEKKYKILLVDDEKDFCVLTKRRLEQLGDFEVTATTDAEEGIDIAKKENLDLVILDVVMPKLQGSDVAQILLDNPKTKNVPILFLTSMITKTEIGRGLIKKIGGRSFMAKPIDNIDEFTACIKDIIDKGGEIESKTLA